MYRGLKVVSELCAQVDKNMWPSCIPVIGGAVKDKGEKEFDEDFDNPLEGEDGEDGGV